VLSPSGYPLPVMRTYIDITFSSDGTVPTTVAARIHTIAHVMLLTGPHDIVFEWTTVEEFRTRIRAIHDALVGTKAMYRVVTEDQGEESAWYAPLPPSLRNLPHENPGYRSPLHHPGESRIE